LAARHAVGGILATAAVALAGCGDEAVDRPVTTPLPEGGSAFGQQRPERREHPRAPRARAVSLPLPLDRAVAQLFLVGFRGTDPRASFFRRLLERDWGGVVLTRDNYVDLGQVAALAGEVRVVAAKAGHTPPIVAAAQLGGHDSAFPHVPPRAQARVGSAAKARHEAELAGARLRELGVRMTFAPDADVGVVGGPWAGRAFADDPGSVTRLVRAAVAGYDAAGIASAPGNFPGEGSASADPRETVATVGLDVSQLRRADMRPFAAIARRAPAITMSNALYAGFDGVTPATLLPKAIALLRGLGFHGAVVSGDLSAVTLATGGSPAQAAVAALEAGCDLLYVPGNAADQEAAYVAVLRAVRRGRVPMTRIASALTHIAALKRHAGLN
jgi:beta-N-acetylhexosaminidase